MAAGTLPGPGTELGPCDPACTHKDCAQTRAQAETPCRICGEPIGYERGFYSEHNGLSYTHATCLWDEVDREEEKQHGP